ncbi:MAG TPA: hypothetical protein VIS71_13630 [Terrimicrobium sp.]
MEVAAIEQALKPIGGVIASARRAYLAGVGSCQPRRLIHHRGQQGVRVDAGRRSQRAGLLRNAILTEVDASLAWILYQIHPWDCETPMEETQEALHDGRQDRPTPLHIFSGPNGDKCAKL